MADEVIEQYVVRGNSDQTEGRGGLVDREYFVQLDDAIACTKSGRWGVQGLKGDADVVLRRWKVDKDGVKWTAEDVRIWGYRQDETGKWSHGFMDLRDSTALQDPQYVEYLRLKEIYG